MILWRVLRVVVVTRVTEDGEGGESAQTDQLGRNEDRERRHDWTEGVGWYLKPRSTAFDRVSTSWQSLAIAFPAQ